MMVFVILRNFYSDKSYARSSFTGKYSCKLLYVGLLGFEIVIQKSLAVLNWLFL